MSAIFGNQNGPTRINMVQINQSVLGFAVPVVMGKGKIQQSIIWTDGFTETLVNSTGGKGFGSAKGGNQYAYAADVIAALCDGGGGGGILGIGDVWSGQSWLSNTAASETTVITGGTPYTPTNAALMTGDKGVAFTQTYSATLNDLGAPSPTVLTGSMFVPLKRVAYGATLTTGQYSVNPANNQYSYSSADNGKTVTVAYSYALATIKKQLISLIPGSQTIEVGTNTDNEAYSADGGVVYYSTDGTDPFNGTSLTRVSGTPTATGTYSVSLDSASYSSGSPSYKSQPANYNFAPGDIDKEILITYQVYDPASIPIGTQTSLSFTLFEGTPGQEPWALLESSFPEASLGYPGIVLAAYGPMDLGYSAQIQNNTFEVLTADAWGAGISDCNPVRCILQVLTNPVWGLGVGPVPFPVACIDNGTGGTWGLGTGQGTLPQDSTATSWFAANGFFISPVIDRQDNAASLISKWLEAGQCAAFMSEGLLKLVPYGDTSTAGNGCIWVAPSEFVTAFDDTCFLPKGKGKDPVTISASPWQDAYSTVQVSWNNPAHQYAPEITPESDQAAINRYGSRIEDPQSWDFITSLASATFAASMRVKRMVYIRNKYQFSVPLNQGVECEPMDVVYISTTSIWAQGLNNLNLDIVNLPVRITKIVDNPDGSFDMEAEDYPFGVHEPTIYNKNINQGQTQPNQFNNPGDTTAVMFNATGRLVTYGNNEIWIGAAGASSQWGSCNVYASIDGDTYKQIGTIDSAARLGVLASSLPLGADPDTTNSLVVNLILNSAALESATTADADADNTLCYVDGEYVSYSSSVVTAPDQYTMGSYLRRGQMGSVSAVHAAGSNFLRLDNAVLRYAYDPSWAGRVVYLKFQSVNLYGNSAQDLSTLTAVPFTVAGIAATSIFVTGTTPNPVVNTTGLTDLPELAATDADMSIYMDGNHPAQIGVDLQFAAGTSGASSGAIWSLGYAPSGSTPSGSTTPSILITITGDGTGASAYVSWSANGYYPNIVLTPQLYLVGGSGYTHATATVTITNGNSSFPNGTSTYTCAVSAITPAVGVPVQIAVLMDGSPVLGPLTLTTDSTGAINYNGSKLIYPSLGNHQFEVQAFNQNSTYAVTSTNRSFQLATLG